MKTENRKIRKSRYTLYEIMIVVTIFIIVLAMLMTAWMHSSNNVRLKNAARIVSGELSLARAKAIGARKDIGVFFNLDKNDKFPAYSMIICNEGNKDDVVPGEEYEKLPGGILFTTTKPGDNEKSADWVSSSASKVVFSKSGSVTGTAINSDKKFYLAPGNQGDKLLAGKQPYYEIVINEFTGRITLKYCEE